MTSVRQIDIEDLTGRAAQPVASDDWPWVSRYGTLQRNHYRVISCDIPWHYKNWNDKKATRSAHAHYPTMTLDEIKALPVKDLAARDCVLLMWVIDTHLDQALSVMKAWGFSYRTVAFTWVKVNKGAWHEWLMARLQRNLFAKMTRHTSAEPTSEFFMGMGHWTRANPEMCWLATRGKPSRRETGKGVRQLIFAPLREHSRKPDEYFPAVERLLEGPYCELFPRQVRKGWDQWGNEVKFEGEA